MLQITCGYYAYHYAPPPPKKKTSPSLYPYKKAFGARYNENNQA